MITALEYKIALGRVVVWSSSIDYSRHTV
jgi:hypothetical protein